MDDEKMDKIYDAAGKQGLVVLAHAGDYRFDFSSPKRIANVIKKHPDLKFVAAHFGGYTEWDKSEEFLVGKNVFFDTSSTLFKLPIEKAMQMIKKHGVEKFLFGTDYPMWNHKEEFERFSKLPLSEEEKQMILYKNAANLLDLSL